MPPCQGHPGVRRGQHGHPQHLHQGEQEPLQVINNSFQDPYAKKFMKDEKFTKTDYIANSGGLLGLCMGFSLVSAAEIIYHCVIGIFSPLCGDKEERRGDIEEDMDEKSHDDKNEYHSDESHRGQPNFDVREEYIGSLIDYETPELDTFAHASHQHSPKYDTVNYDSVQNCLGTGPASEYYSRHPLNSCSVQKVAPYGPYRHLLRPGEGPRHFTSPSADIS